MRITTSINLRNNWHHADHNFNQPAEQLASSGSQLQSTCGTIGIKRITTSINLRNNWHHADHNFNQPAEQLASSGSQLQSTCGTIGILRTSWHQLKALLQFWCGQLGTNRKFYFNFDANSLATIESSTSIFMLPMPLSKLWLFSNIFVKIHQSYFFFKNFNYAFQRPGKTLKAIYDSKRYWRIKFQLLKSLNWPPNVWKMTKCRKYFSENVDFSQIFSRKRP